MEMLIRDIRDAVAAARTNRGVALAAVLTIALGIGATTAVFSVIEGVLLRPLPYPDADRTVRVFEEHQGGVTPLGDRFPRSLPHAAWGRRPPLTLNGMAAYSTDTYTIGFDDES